MITVPSLRIDREHDAAGGDDRRAATAAAFVRFQELRVALADTELHRALVGTLRLRLDAQQPSLARRGRGVVRAFERGREQGAATGGVPLSVGLGGRYWLDSPPGGPEGFGMRFVVTLLFPK